MANKLPRKKLKSGRPTKYRPDMCQIVVDCGKQGLSKEAIAGALGITKDTLYKWLDPSNTNYQKDFADAMQASQSYSRFYMENLMHKKIINKDGNLNNGIVALIMRNVHNWDQKQTIEHTGADGEALTFNFNLAPQPTIQAIEVDNDDDEDDNNSKEK